MIGGGDAAQLLIDEVDFVMFTGSTATGKKVMARAAETLTPVGLELGGKDPMIVLADADLERAANAATYYSMQNGGQTCVSIERVYVEAPIYDQFVDAVTDRVKALRQGPPTGRPASRSARSRSPRSSISCASTSSRLARRAPVSPPAGMSARGAAASSSRPCWRTSTTR